ncbi:unnamed protein product [Haemonchus placei]|uniref:Uncharacterized protein n=1 Tax=Haemonchus placei TaxID=6290 RepID=A0A0N4VVI6_HAEPC|nr:unnamed protein product [Haemonchus placei]
MLCLDYFVSVIAFSWATTSNEEAQAIVVTSMRT